MGEAARIIQFNRTKDDGVIYINELAEKQAQLEYLDEQRKVLMEEIEVLKKQYAACPKYCLDGTEKQTPNNQAEDRWVDPIREKSDIERVKQYLQDKIDDAPTYNKRQKAIRNKFVFSVGILLGLRVSDLSKLKWDDIFEKDMTTFRKMKNIKEQKTGKTRKMYHNEQIEDAVKEYIMYSQVTPKAGEYLFTDGKGGHIKDGTVSQIVKDFAKNCNLVGNYNTHSIRKTFAYQLYMDLCHDKEEWVRLQALAIVQEFLNHRNQIDTLRYLGLNQAKIAEVIERVYGRKDDVEKCENF